jgi:hypothetical protein
MLHPPPGLRGCRPPGLDLCGELSALAFSLASLQPRTPAHALHSSHQAHQPCWAPPAACLQCPTEIIAFSDRIQEFRDIGVEVGG